MKEITNYEADAIKTIVNTLPKDERSKFIKGYMDRYELTSYFVELFRPYITKEMFSTAKGLTAKMVKIHNSLFDKEAYEEKPGTVSLLYDDVLIHIYNFNLSKIFQSYKSIPVELSEYLLSLNTGYEESIIQVSQLKFLNNIENIKKYYDLYKDENIISKALTGSMFISNEKLKLLCRNKTLSLSFLMGIMMLIDYNKNVDYINIFNSINVINIDEVTAEDLSSFVVEAMCRYTLNDFSSIIAKFLNEKISTKLIEEVVDIIDKADMNNDKWDEIKEILTSVKINIRKTPNVVYSTNATIDLEDGDYGW